MGWDAGYVPFNRNNREALKAHLMNEYTFECQDGSRWVAESISLKSNVAHILARYVPAGADVETLGDCAPYLFTVLIRWEGADLATKGIGCDPGNSTVPKKYVKVLYDSIIQGNPNYLTGKQNGSLRNGRQGKPLPHKLRLSPFLALSLDTITIQRSSLKRTT